ncbi:site-specific integrase [Bacteroides mediterraneensis]|uniref:Site-specific integrase n=1 Tax=Bacteroides mediterraneensis TaxID=1841856 RepID=A0ABS2EXI7_9BACE|nr:site-specific integrase [Bacteroides mediterraneensis]MBM6759306.1 site-specific integrase [Bacteroides mediterraneensis]
MVRSSFAILFFIRESRVRKDGTASIEVVLTVNGERCAFSTGKRVKSCNWDKAKQQVKGKDEEAQSLNNYLKAIKAKLYQKEAELLDRGFIITTELLRDAYFDKVESLKEKTLFEVFEEHNQEQEKLVGNGVSKATYWISVYTVRLLKEFVQQKYKREDLYLRELNLNFIQSFHSFLRIDKGMAQNSSTKHLKLLKKIVNLAVANSYMTTNPFITYKIEREPVEIDFLDEEELRKIINFDTPLPRLERAKDMFLFGCFTGLSYIDIKTLAPEHLEKDSTGRIWIKKRRVKTGVLSRIPLLPIAKLILDKYKGGEKLLPIQDPADINKYLKDIAILCDIKKRITFHTSRHTFASTVTLANNISLEVVSKMLGHTNTRMTNHYAKLIDKCIGEQMDKLMETFTGDSNL